MRTDLEHLAKLQAVEIERSRLMQSARALPVEIQKAETALAAAQQKSAAASDALAREDSLRTKLEREIAGHRQKAARYKAQLDSVTTSAQAAAIEHEVGFAESEIEPPGERGICQPGADRSAGSRAGCGARAGGRDGRDPGKDARLGLRRSRRRSQPSRQCFRANAKTLRGRSSPDLLTRFDRIAASRGTGLARR